MTILPLPTHIRVGPYRYSVVITTEEIEEARFGATSHNVKQQISLNPNNSPQRHLGTFIHEVLHAAAHVYAVKIEEKDVERLANGLTQALQSCKLLPRGLEMPDDSTHETGA